MGYSYHQVLVSTEYGGAAEILVRLAQHLHANEHEQVLTWVPGPGRAWQKARELGLPIQQYDSDRLLSRSRVVSGLANVGLGVKLRNRRPGLVHVNDPFYYAALRLGLRLSGLPTVVHVQIEHDLSGLRWALQYPPNLIITCATFLAEQVRSVLPAGVRGTQRIAVVPNSVDVERFHPADKAVAKRAVGAPSDRPLLLMLANLAPHKGQETAVRAVAELRSRGIRVSCWMAGVEREEGGQFRNRLESMIVSAGLVDDIRLIGFRDDAPLLLQAADAMLLPSTNEGLPLTIIEAQATRVPVIAAPTAGVPEVIRDGETGFLAAAADATAYADRIADLLRTPQRFEPMLDRAYHQATTDYSWRRSRDRICELYQDLLERYYEH